MRRNIIKLKIYCKTTRGGVLEKKVTGKEGIIVLIDIYKIASNTVTCEEVPTVIEKLNLCGFSKWIEEE